MGTLLRIRRTFEKSHLPILKNALKNAFNLFWELGSSKREERFDLYIFFEDYLNIVIDDDAWKWFDGLENTITFNDLHHDYNRYRKAKAQQHAKSKRPYIPYVNKKALKKDLEKHGLFVFKVMIDGIEREFVGSEYPLGRD